MEQKKKVLIVDDKTVNSYILRDIFEDEYDVVECIDGNEAIAALKESTKDMAAILLDIIMPECDGFNVLEYMKEQRLQSIPVILISAKIDDENMHKAYEYEVADYIQKPFDEEVVKKRVENIIKLFEKKKYGR